MLNNHRAIATLAVRDLSQARRFYEDVLGLEPAGGEGDELVCYRCGDSLLNVYHSDYAGTNQATAVTFPVGDRLDDEVAVLKTRGVRFEHYELPGLKREGDVHVGARMRVAWFKDPDGNILNLVTG